jgi:PAS domain S-box-containing protein
MNAVLGDDLAGALLNASPDGVLLVDASGRIRLANPASEEIFGRSAAELTGMVVEELVPVEQRATHLQLREGFANDPHDRPMRTGLRMLAEHSERGVFPVEISLSVFTVDDELLTIAAVRDVSDREESNARVALSDERERIARDLHDLVIQRIFGAGMTLQATVDLVDSPTVRDRMSAVIDDLDETIHEVRAAIFRLSHVTDAPTLSERIRVLTEERARHLPFTPQLTVDEEVDELPGYIAEQVEATLAEALSNVARHSSATEATIEVLFGRDKSLTVRVDDNGVGIAATPKPYGGLSNMMWRAAELGGTCSVSPSTPTGTRLVWKVPVGAGSITDA